MKTAIINVKSTPSIKKSAEAFSKELGLSLSDLVNLSLKQTLATRRIVIDAREEPNEETKQVLREGARGAKKFASVDEAFASLNI